ncbi:MAG: FAD:protein FMN transferase [Planctomycetota bacterium]
MSGDGRRRGLRAARSLRAAGWLVLLILSACGKGEVEPWRLQGTTMGTTWSVRLPKASVAEARLAELKAGIQDTLDRVDLDMSTYIEESSLSRFNRTPKGEWYLVSPEMADVVRKAMAISIQSEGAYDITVGPLVDLWGFGPERGPDRVPTDEEIAAALKKVGNRNIAVRRDPPALRKSVEGLEIDLSSIAKGHGVDRVAEWLDEQGLTAYLIEVGGEIRTRGERQEGTAWRVAIEKPTKGGRAVHRLLSMTDLALATSGDYRNFFELGGEAYSHTIDPKTGRPVKHALTSVSVVAQTCALADGWATAIEALGPEAGFEIAESESIAALLLIRNGDTIQERRTKAFDALFPSEG